MELSNFLNLVKKFRLVLILIPFISVVVTYFLVRKLPNVYQSQAQIATGIVDESQNLISQIAAESQISQKFSNMIAVMQMKKIENQVAYRLMLHDLTSPNPFRISKDFKNLNLSARRHAVEVYSLMYETHGALSLDNKDQFGLDKVIGSQGYDPAAISAKLNVFRPENSDFISVQFESENPELSAFVVNTLIREFMTYYVSQTKNNENKQVKFLDSLMTAKKVLMDTAISQLKEYKIKNHILSLTEQARSLYTQLADIETRKQQADKDVAAYTGSIASIDRQFNPVDKKYIETNLTQLNSSILNTKQRLEQLTDTWVKSGYSDNYKRSIDSLKIILNHQINESVDKSTNGPLATKTNLLSQRLTMQVALDVAKYSISSLDNEVTRLHSRLDVLVPNEAVIQSLENNVDILTREYLEVLQKYNQTAMQSSYSSKLQQIDLAEPEAPQASKKMLLVASSGVVSVTLCLLVLFILFYLDNSIKHPNGLANTSGLPVLGVLNVTAPQALDPKKLGNAESPIEDRVLKDQLRSIRFEVDQALKANKVLAITSLGNGEGKTTIALALAHSYAIVGKKVLIIDGDFDNRTISATLPLKTTVEDYLKFSILNSDAGITVLGNKGSDLTLLEIQDEKIITERIKELKLVFDIIIIETPALDQTNKAKEWFMFSDNVISVFEGGQSLNEVKKQGTYYLKTLGDKFSGWIFNKMDPKNSI